MPTMDQLAADLAELEQHHGKPAGQIDSGDVLADLGEMFGHQSDAGDVAKRAAAYLAACGDVERAQEAVQAAQEACRNAETDLIRDMDRAKLLSVTVDDGGYHYCVTATKKTYPSVLVADQESESFKAWLAANKGTDLIKERINPQSFRKFCREIQEGGGVLHPAVKVVEERAVSITKKK